MTLRKILGWWRMDLIDWWQTRYGAPKPEYPAGKEGRMCRFTSRGETMGYRTYTVWARRGQFVIGRIEYRNQWGYYAFIPDANHHVEIPVNKEIIAEIYAMLRELGS